jgi:hypothetical protein
MSRLFKRIFSLLIILCLTHMVRAQGMKMGEVIFMSSPALKTDLKPEALHDYINDEIKPAWKPWITTHLFRADRGEKKGEYLLVCSLAKAKDRDALPPGNPFKENAYTEYRVVGGDKLKSLPVAGILGVHFMQVKPERSGEFEKYVVEKLHPALGQLLPDMGVLYYKGVAGENSGAFITIFAIESAAARDKYWPAGAPETEAIKQVFRPLKEVAVQLGSFLLEDSYLKPESGGAAAYFESARWTDFIHQ